MLPLLQHTSRFPSVARSCLRVRLSYATRRSISVTPTRWSTSAPEPPTPEEEAELEAVNPEPILEVDEEVADIPEDNEAGDGSESRSWKPRSYNEFLSSIGAKYKFAKPTSWLGGEVPFPMNPSFKPPPPQSDAVRQEIYNKFMLDPKKNNIRMLSQHYHLSLKRVDAILRLKGLEHSWYKVKFPDLKQLSSVDPLCVFVKLRSSIGILPTHPQSLISSQNKQIQYGFQTGMEKILGVRRNKAEHTLGGTSRWDVMEADSLEQDENRDAQRQRYQRHYWESVPDDGREPIVPASLEHAKKLAQRLVKFEEDQKSTHPRLMPQFPDTKYLKTPAKIQTLEKPGRPTIEIQDVGGRFLDLNDRLKRIAVAERRAREKQKKREKRKATILASKS